MNAKLYIAIIGILTAATLSSCKKNDGSKTQTGTCQINSVTGYYPNILFVQYDSLGRIDTMDAGDQFFRSYEYDDTSINIITYKKNLVTEAAYVKLDADSIPEWQYIDFQNGKKATIYYYYTNKYLSKEIRVFNNGDIDSTMYTWVGGNLVKAKSSSGIATTGEIAYYTENAFQIGDYNHLNNLLSNSYKPLNNSANLVKSNYGTENIIYTYNDAGWIAQMKINRTNFNPQTIALTYSCK